MIALQFISILFFLFLNEHLNVLGEKNPKEGKTDLTIEVGVLVDYSVLASWLVDSNGSPEEAKKNVLEYYGEVFKHTDLIFKEIQSTQYSFNIQLSYVQFIDTKKQSFTEEKNVQIHGKIYFRKAILELIDRMRAGSYDLKDRDVLIAFTKWRPITGEASLANVDRICYNESVALVMDVGVYGSAQMVASALASCLGAKLDSVGNKCEMYSRFLMAKNFHDFNVITPPSFSKCSIDSIEKYLKTLKREDNCLLVTRAAEVVVSQEEIYLGEKYSVDQQCQQIFGTGASFCSEGKVSDASKCERLFCKEPHRGRCIYTAQSRVLEGSPCGSEAWCVRGQCVENKKLTGLEDCMHGDSRWRHVGDYHSDFCASLKEGYMGKACAFKTVSNRCCATCKEIMKKR